MRKVFSLFSCCLGAQILAGPVYLHGTTFLSNLAEVPIGTAAIGRDAWIGQTFISGTNPLGYTLDSVDLLTASASGNPAGFVLSIYDNASGPFAFNGPGISLGNLNGSDPSTSGIHAFAASSISLTPGTIYYLVATASTQLAEGSFHWSTTRPGAASSADGWIAYHVYYGSADGLSWQVRRSQEFQFAINATPIPEPSSLSMLGLGGSLLAFSLLRIRRS